MEILIKAKQANNPQFSFLSIDGRLHPYYRYMLNAIKSGKYNPEKQPEKEESGTHIFFLLFLLKTTYLIVNVIECDIVAVLK